MAFPPAGGRCPSAHTGADEGFHVLTPWVPPSQGAPARQASQGRPGGGNELSRLRGSERSVAWPDDVGRGIPDAPFARHRDHLSISEAWHRRRPGGPGWYSAAIIRACRVVDAGHPRRGSACNETARKTGGKARLVSALFVQPTAAMSPRTGGRRGVLPPAPSFPPFLWEEMGAPAAQAPAGGRASMGRADDIRPYRLSVRPGRARRFPAASSETAPHPGW